MRNGLHGLPLAALVTLLFASPGVWAQPATSPAANHAPPASTSLTDASFASQAARDNLTDLKLSQLAAARSENPQLRLFAEQMITEHSSAGVELQRLAADHGLTLPATPSVAQDEMLTTLAQQQGRRFDEAYVKQLQHSQDAAVTLFEQAAANDRLTADLRAFAHGALPKLKSRQQRARALNDAVAGLQPMSTVMPSRRVHHVW